MLVVFQPGNDGPTSGIALTIAGVTACAVYTVLSSRYLIEASTVTVVLVQQVAAVAGSAVVASRSAEHGAERVET